MAPVGYVAHAAQSRRRAIWLFAAYILSFEAMGAFALVLPLLFLDLDHSILSNPLGYAQRYVLPLAVVGAVLFIDIYRSHARLVAQALQVRIVTRAEEPRFVALAEEACTILGVRLPRFGVIEEPQPNAVTVGEGPTRGLIAVTRGLIDQLDDDELLAVLAHEASHIRQGDTRVLAANYALMRTAVNFQTHNVLRFEDWRTLILPLLFPPVLPILLVSSATTMFAMGLARKARRGVKLSRDHVADGEAVRVSHFPEALISALSKIGGRGAFRECWRAEDMLFDGRADVEGGTHPAIADRIAAIKMLGRDLMSPTRARRDTRASAVGGFGRRAVAAAPSSHRTDGRPLERPPQDLKSFLRALTNREFRREWQRDSVSWHEWRASDKRNAFGLTPKMVIPVFALSVFLLVFHWPADGNWRAFTAKFSPVTFVAAIKDVGDKLSLAPKCRGADCASKVAKPPRQQSAGTFSTTAQPRPQAELRGKSSERAAQKRSPSNPPSLGAFAHIWVVILIFAFIHTVRPQWLKASTRRAR